MSSTAFTRQRSYFSYAGLLLAALVWGAAFVPQKLASESVGPFTVNALRFSIGGLIVLSITGFSRWRAFSLRDFSNGSVMGALLFLGAALQQIGLTGTTAGKASFITGLYIVLVPLILVIIWRIRSALTVWIGAGLAIVGLGLLSLKSDFSVASGDIWVLGCAIAFAFHTIAIGRFSPTADPISLAIVQFLVCGLLSLCPAIIFERGSFRNIPNIVPELTYLSLISIGVGYTLQVVCQKYVPASNAAIILGLEAVFGAFAGWWALDEILSIRQVIGACIILMATLIAQIQEFESTN